MLKINYPENTISKTTAPQATIFLYQYMRVISIFFVALLLLSFASDRDNIIQVPFKLVKGYGNFNPSFSPVASATDFYGESYQKQGVALLGIPENWQEAQQAVIYFDIQQFIYQNYKQGNFTEESFQKLKKDWNINLEKIPLSEEPIKCFVYIVYSKDKEGKLKYKIDTNNNLDFSDEKEYVPFEDAWKKLDSLAQCCSHTIQYEAFREGKLRQLTIPLLVMNWSDNILYNMPEYGEGLVEGQKILVSSNFHYPTYDSPYIALPNQQKELVGYGIAENEYIFIGDKIYQNKGVDINKQVLFLKKIPKGSPIVTSQVGFQAPAFEGNEFTSNAPIRSSDYKGKFLFLDFWGSWCGPCRQELPHLKEAYKALDKNKVAFLGIAYDKAAPLRKILDSEKIEWPQILCEGEEGIIKNYNVDGYPTTFLLDPEGKIVAKNLRGESLADSIRYHVERYQFKK